MCCNKEMLTGVESRSSLLSTSIHTPHPAQRELFQVCLCQEKEASQISQTQWWDHDAHRGKAWDGRTGFGPHFSPIFSLPFFYPSLCSRFALSKSGTPLPTQWAFRLWDLRVKDWCEDQSVWNPNHAASNRFICGTNPGRSLRGVVSSAQWVNDWLQIAKHNHSDIRISAASTSHDLNCSTKPPACLHLLSMLSHFPFKLSGFGWCHQCFLWTKLTVLASFHHKIVYHQHLKFCV